MSEMNEKKHCEEAFIEAMKTKADSESGLKEAFKCLSQDRSTGPNPITVDVLRRVMANRDVNLTDMEVAEIVGQVKAEWKDGEPIIDQDFIGIFKKLKECSVVEQLKECSVVEQLKEIYNVIAEGESKTVVLEGESGVGKTWMAKKVADRAVRKGKFKCAIWIYPNRNYKKGGLTLHESLAFQLFLMLDFYKAEAEAAKHDAEMHKTGMLKKRELEQKEENPAEAAKHGVKEQEGENDDTKKKELERTEEKLEGKHVDEVDEEMLTKEKLIKWKKTTLEGMIRKAVEVIEDKKLLLIFDNVQVSDADMEPLLSELWEILGLQKEEEQRKKSTFLITRCSSKEKASWNDEKVIKVMPWTRSEAQSMFKTKVEEAKKELADAETEAKKKMADAETEAKKKLADAKTGEGEEEAKKKLADTKAGEDDEAKKKLADAKKKLGEAKEKIHDADFFIEKSKSYPAEILVIAKCMNYLWWEKGEKGLQELKTIKEEMEEEKDCTKVIQRLITAYDPIPKSILIDCYSEIYRNHFLHKGRCMVHFSELICYWIMEGHLGEFVYFQDAYNKGYRVLTDLLDCGLLRKLEDSYVEWSGLKFKFKIEDYYKFFGDVRLGMADTFDMKLGKIALADGILRTVGGREEADRSQASKKPLGGAKLHTLMLDGNHFEIPEHGFFKDDHPKKEESVSGLARKGFFEPELENFAVFNPTVKPFPLPTDGELKKLRLLVLRGCRYLNKFSEDKSKSDDPADEYGVKYRAVFSECPSGFPLRYLTILEISGPSILNEFPDFFFEKMPDLRSVNLSALEITFLPGSFYKLKKVEYLILKDCCRLKVLESLANFSQLQLLDASGSTHLRSFKQKNFVVNKELRVINFSRTFIDRIPLLRSLQKLISLTLSDCPDLRGMRKINGLNTLQVLDVSGSKKVEEFLDPLIVNLGSIEILDVSKTSMRRLPPRMGDPRVLLVRDCLKLRDLLPINSLSKVEILDISGCCKLKEIKNDFMKNLKCLRDLNLSRTGIEYLPRLPNPLSLRSLLLSGCESLKKLSPDCKPSEEWEGLKFMENLEKLDLSGCKSLPEIGDGTFDKMNQLHTLSLSGLQVKKLPSLSELKKLQMLYVQDCPNLTSLPGNLRVHKKLDHSGTMLQSSPTFGDSCCPVVIGPIASSSEFNPQTLLIDLGAKRAESASSSEFNPQTLLMELGAERVELESPPIVLTVKNCNWKISRWATEPNASQKSPSDGVHFLQLLKECPSLFGKCAEFHLQIVPMDLRIQLPDELSYKDELKLRRLYFTNLQIQLPDGSSGRNKLKQVPEMDMLKKCLEIRGFNNSPESTQCLLSKADSVVLIDNPFFTSLFKLGPEGVEDMKVCWIERCNEMKYLIQPDDARSREPVFTESFKNLQILWLSHDMKLEKIISDRKKLEEKSNLENKSSEMKPVEKLNETRLKNKSSEMKPEEKLTKLEEKSSEMKPEEKLTNLEENLSEMEPEEKLMKLEERSSEMKPEEKLTKLEERSSEMKPEEKLTKLEERSSEMKPEEKLTKLEERSSEMKPEETLTKLEERSSEMKPEEKLTKLEERSSEMKPEEKLTKLEERSSEMKPEEKLTKMEERSSEMKPEEKLTKLEERSSEMKPEEKLTKLEEKSSEMKPEEKLTKPEEKSSEMKREEKLEEKSSEMKLEEKSKEMKLAGKSSKMKSVEKSNETKLETKSSEMKLETKSEFRFQSLKILYLEFCPELKSICSSINLLESLEALHIRYCNNLVTLFDDNSDKHAKLTELRLWGLPKLSEMKLNAPSLQKLRVGDCHLLKHVLASVPEKLDTLQIKLCCELMTICEGDDCLPNARELELWGLPKLKGVLRPVQGTMKLERMIVGECDSLEKLVETEYPGKLKEVAVKSCEKLKKIFDVEGMEEMETWPEVEKMELVSLPELERIPPLRANVRVIWGCPEADKKGESEDYSGR